VTLHKELPHGQTVAGYIKRFTVDSKRAQFLLDIPGEYRPQILIELPSPTTIDSALAVGNVTFDTVLGDIQIGIAKGDLLLHTEDDGFKKLEASVAIGGIRDKRPGGHSHGRFATTWIRAGTGAYSVTASIAMGKLILLPKSPTPPATKY
jgi:hypothetical protein